MKSSQINLASSTPATVKCGNLYDDLELDRLANPEEIKVAFRRMALNHHPDKTTYKEEVKMKSCSIPTDQFLRAREAWEVLGNECKRRAYDEKLKQHDPPDHVWQEVRWDNLLMSEEEEEDRNPGMRYYWPCRCGEYFEIEKEDGKIFWDQNEDDDGKSLTKCPEKRKGQNISFVVGCVSCSLHIRVLPTQSTLIGAQDMEKDLQKQKLRETVLHRDVILRLILEAIGERQWLFWGGVCKSWRDCCKEMKGDFMCTTSPLGALESLSRLHLAVEAGLDLFSTRIKVRRRESVSKYQEKLHMKKVSSFLVFLQTTWRHNLYRLVVIRVLNVRSIRWLVCFPKKMLSKELSKELSHVLHIRY